jgi:hypothetical protein
MAMMGVCTALDFCATAEFKGYLERIFSMNGGTVGVKWAAGLVALNSRGR